ncbi:alpha-L-rhamnosidase [Kribbella amoyensis]|uniref:alpha-L-rhamnosidase n=1 Tax=Kribbella amoyensis TaxID=996641 RepID=A0A561C0G1_9ACTN|nr:family 78 glycoside hydrolase catalytic domain [Kribbella amoyensis]TWD84635.1 alpha-L-rhamnosidase [Kribbella amoyensis]
MTLEQQTGRDEQIRRATPYDLRIDGRPSREEGSRAVNPAFRPRPRLSWRTDAADREGYEVVVLAEDGRSVWSSGPRDSVEFFVAVGTELVAHAVYRWRVRVRTGEVWSEWAEASFETGPTSTAARWIGVPTGTRLRQGFRSTGDVERARLHLTAQGLVRAEIDGAPINPGRLDATRTDVTRALVRSYDVTDLVTPGQHALDLVLGLGEWQHTGHEPRVLAELVIRYRDGSVEIVCPDESARLSASRIAIDSPLYLERHDVGLEAGATWTPITEDAFVSTALTLEIDPTPPARVVSSIVPIERSRHDGVRLYDLGVNIAGRSRVELTDAVPTGTIIRVVHGEHVDADGRLDTTNLTMPYDNGRVRQVVEWVATGSPGDVVEPWFAYHGFRYVEVHGLPDDVRAEVRAETLHTALESRAQVVTDNPLVTRLLERAERTMLNNVHGVPEDCPTREQSAWTGDTASVAEYELAAFDTENFLAKWLRDLMTSQQPDGAIPAVAPDVREQRLPADPVWGSAFHRILLGHWLHYGDDALVREALPALRRWADFQLGCRDEDGVVGRSPISYGHDWLALEQTPPPVHHTGATIDCLVALAQLETAFGDDPAAQARRDQADQLRAAARARFHDPARGVFANGSQGAYAVAIEAGILTGGDAEQAAQRISQDILARGNRISGGFATTRSIVRALTTTGHSNVIAELLAQPAAPGIGAMLSSGPGTFWECWWIDPANTGTGSLDHVGLGGPFASWVWEGLAGLRPTSAGYRSFVVAPQFVAGVNDLGLRTRTPRGEVRVSYRFAGSTVAITVDIPPATTATLVLPGEPPRELTAGQHAASIEYVRAAAVVPEPDEKPWTAPSLAPRSADVTGPDGLLRSAIADGRLSTPGSELHLVDRLNCMPIPHAQPLGPIARVLPVDGEAPVARITFAEPLDASDVTFAYALVDLCHEKSAHGAFPTLRLIGADTSERTAVGTTWPAGVNRVAVDLTDWPGRAAVVAVEVSLRFPAHDTEDRVMPASTDAGPRGFHLADIGLSTARRTW